MVLSEQRDFDPLLKCQLPHSSRDNLQETQALLIFSSLLALVVENTWYVPIYLHQFGECEPMNLINILIVMA